MLRSVGQPDHGVVRDGSGGTGRRRRARPARPAARRTRPPSARRRPRRRSSAVYRGRAGHVHAVGQGQAACGTDPSRRGRVRGRGVRGRRGGHRRATVSGHAVARRPAHRGGGSRRQDVEARRSRWVPSSRSPKVHVPREARGRDGEVRGSIPRARQPSSGSASCAGISRRTSASGRSPAAKNGRPWVWSQCQAAEQDRPRNGSPSSRVCEPRKPVPASSTSVGALGVVVGDGHARRDPPPLRARARRPASTRARHRGGGASASAGDLPGDDPPPAAQGGRGRAAAAAATATRQAVTARNDEVRRPPSSTARSPRTAPGPSSAIGSPSTSTGSTPSSRRNSSAPGLPLLDEACRP